MGPIGCGLMLIMQSVHLVFLIFIVPIIILIDVLRRKK